MCRSIKTLRQREAIASDEEIRAAALQYVRKVTGFREPSARHQEAFDDAVADIAQASRKALRRISRRMASARPISKKVARAHRRVGAARLG